MFGYLHNQLLKHTFDFQIQHLDIEQLNQQALEAKHDITKISCQLYPHIQDEYQILDAGAALGFKNGPLLVTAMDRPPEYHEMNTLIPGMHTTANFLLSHLFPTIQQKTERIFSDIERLLLAKEYHAGLLIHENRFTYHERGLHKLADLGEEWEKRYQMPIPLGVIVVRRSLSEQLKKRLSELLTLSVQKAYQDSAPIEAYIASHAQEMTPEVCHQHIELYVNDYSIALGKQGREAVEFFLKKVAELQNKQLLGTVFV